MYTILGATGHIGTVIARKLLEKGENVRVFGRSAERLREFAEKGAEAAIGDVKDVAALTQALTGARAAFLMVPPSMTAQDYRAEQDQTTDALAAAAKASGLQYAVNLSSYGAQAPSGTGPILGLHFGEKKLNAVEKLNVLHLRPGYFMENHLSGIGMIQTMGIYGGALKGDLKIPMIETRDIGVAAAERLLNLDFSGKQTQELLGERDLTMNEVATVLGKAIGKPDLKYMQFPYEQVQQVLLQAGIPTKTAAQFIEMFRGINEGVVVPVEPRTAANTTPTSIETFAKEVFAPAYLGKAASA
jgi:uncharacterized protein YbjT (DUF2867 family)